jgi:hypothetical protein
VNAEEKLLFDAVNRNKLATKASYQLAKALGRNIKTFTKTGHYSVRSLQIAAPACVRTQNLFST